MDEMPTYGFPYQDAFECFIINPMVGHRRRKAKRSKRLDRLRKITLRLR